MEKLASQGIRFNQFYAMNVCSPTRISLMTGQNAARHRSTNWINPTTDNRGKQGPPNWNWKRPESDSVTLPGLLRKLGYRTIHIGKGHFGPQDSAGADPRRLGFDENVGGAAFGAPEAITEAKTMVGHSQGASRSAAFGTLPRIGYLSFRSTDD